MDKNNLEKKLNSLLTEGQNYTFNSFPLGGGSGGRWISGIIPEWSAWTQRIRSLTNNSFKNDSAPFRLIQIGLQSAESIRGNSKDIFDKARSNLLKGLELGIEAIKDDFHNEVLGQPESSVNAFDLKDVFIVHGHNHEAKNELELFLKELGLNPIVLHRKVDEGQTIIEKFEKYSNVGYAIILLTPDDTVASSGKTAEEKRARQNVIFEFGFFAGRLRRNRVCCLYQENVSLPSDLSGLIYKPFKNHIEEIKFALIKELKAAGYQVSL